MKEYKPGVYYNMPFKEYLLIDAVNSSHLKALSIVAANAKLPREDTKFMKFGRPFHTCILEEPRFWDNFIIVGDIAGNTTKGRGTLAELLMNYAGLMIPYSDYKDGKKKPYKEYVIETVEKKTGKEILTHTDYGLIKQMKKAVEAHPFAGEVLKSGRNEVTAVWRDDETGLMCKTRPDKVCETPILSVYDLKSANSAEKYIFRNQVKNLKYHWSAAFNMEGLGIITGKEYEVFSFIVVEKEPPYRTEVYTMPTDFIDNGYKNIHYWLREEVKFRKLGFYPHFKATIIDGILNAGADELPTPQWLTEGEYE